MCAKRSDAIYRDGNPSEDNYADKTTVILREGFKILKNTNCSKPVESSLDSES